VTRYPYTFAGPLQADELHSLIAALVPVLPGFLGLAQSGSVVEVLFTAALSGSDQGRLNTLLASYAPAADFPARQLRAAAQALLADGTPSPALLRAVLLTALDRLNVLAAQHDALLTWLGTQTALTSRSALSGMVDNQVSAVQMRAAVAAKINTGAADA
jgi:hypothetical protein